MVQEMTRIPEQVRRTKRDGDPSVIDGPVKRGFSRSVRSMANRPRGGHRLTNTVPKSRPFGKSNFRAGRLPPDHPGPFERARFLCLYLVIRCELWEPIQPPPRSI